MKQSLYFPGNFAITGGAGFGKTSIIDELGRRGYTVIPEVTREFLIELIKEDSSILPWKDRSAFQDALIPKRLETYLNAQTKSAPRFSDRGLLDEIGYMLKDNLAIPKKHADMILVPTYDEVFLVPPWPEIHVKDIVRTSDFKESLRVHNIIVDVYKEHGYKLVEIPKLSVEKRADFVLNYIKEKLI